MEGASPQGTVAAPRAPGEIVPPARVPRLPQLTIRRPWSRRVLPSARAQVRANASAARRRRYPGPEREVEA